MKDKQFDIDRLSQEELKERINNINKNIIHVQSKKGLFSCKQMIIDYEERLK
jgi:hypothetical protein